MPLSRVRENLAIDDAALAAGQECFHVWESPVPVVVLGRSCPEEAAVDVEMVRRSSGGGTVVLGPGCCNFSLVLDLDKRPELRHVEGSYRHILRWMISVLGVPGLEIRGVADLALEGRKVSGNAQRRTARAVLHQGTLLYDFDAGLTTRYLQEPARAPEYRAGRTHGEFLGNLPLTREQLYGLEPIANRCLPPRM